MSAIIFTCSSCRNEINYENNFCQHCGAKLTKDSSQSNSGENSEHDNTILEPFVDAKLESIIGLNGESSITFTSDSNYFVINGEWGEVQIWNLKSGKLVKTFKDVDQIEFTPNKKYIILVVSGSILIYNINNQKISQSYNKTCFRFKSISDELIIGHDSSRMIGYVLGINNNLDMKLPIEGLYNASISLDSKYIVGVSGIDGFLRIFDTEMNSITYTLEIESVENFMISSDNKFLVTSYSLENNIHTNIYNLNNGVLINTIERCLTFGVTPDNNYIFCRTGYKKNFELLNIFTGESYSECVSNSSPHGTFYNPKFTKNNNYALVIAPRECSNPWDIYVYDFKNHEVIVNERDKHLKQESIAIFNNGSSIAVVNKKNSIEINNLDNPQQVKVLSFNESTIYDAEEKSRINMVEFSNDNKYLVVLREGQYIISVFSVDTGKLIYEIVNTESGILAMSPNGYFNTSNKNIIDNNLKVEDDKIRELTDDELSHFFTENILHS